MITIKKNVFLIVLSATILLGIVAFFFQKRVSAPVSDSVIPKQAEQEVSDTKLQQAVGTLIEGLVASAPLNNDEESVNAAVGLFSEGEKSQIPVSSGEYRLAGYFGVQDVPDEGYEIINIEYMDNPASGEENAMAEVTVTLKYSGGNVQRVILLTKSGDSWLVDGIKEL